MLGTRKWCIIDPSGDIVGVYDTRQRAINRLDSDEQEYYQIKQVDSDGVPRKRCNRYEDTDED